MTASTSSSPAAQSNAPRIILASGSPRRSELLTQIGLTFIVMPTDIDETERPAEDPVSYVRRLAIEKALAAQVGADDLVLAADTTVDVDGSILAKPEDDNDARRMLGLLSGRTHQVHTGVAVRYLDRVVSEVSTTNVSVVALDPNWIDWYVSTGEPHGKAGAYAIQGAASVLIDRVEGSVTNVIGLPLALVGQLLTDVGVSLLRLLTP
jgi:septum formation protein